ncbi:MAG TPA: flagellar basal body rod C-terminal domain-containing protein, partial [Patescibacteria group bacterium]|nr:flagellar basal body rod C-terminal domain-containing protein [Patescibacteria group bacterium]
LVKEGGNYFSTSPNSGLPNVGTAVEIFPSTRVASGALEESNVDLTEQFTDLISTQRAFEAASRTVTISDQFLNEINGLKR